MIFEFLQLDIGPELAQKGQINNEEFNEMKLTNWSVKRSGAALTIDGVNQETGRPVKLTGILNVAKGIARDERVTAQCADGKIVELV